MNAVYGQLLTVADREKAVRLEHLDEVEEWQMLMVSVCVYILVVERKIDGERATKFSLSHLHEHTHKTKTKTGSLLLCCSHTRRSLPDAAPGTARLSGAAAARRMNKKSGRRRRTVNV